MKYKIIILFASLLFLITLITKEVEQLTFPPQFDYQNDKIIYNNDIVTILQYDKLTKSFVLSNNKTIPQETIQNYDN